MLEFIKKVLGFGGNERLENFVQEGALLVDVRTREEFKSGSVDGALNIPLDRLEISLNKLPKDKKIVVFCRSGMRSGQAKRFLEGNGYEHVLNGGTWSKVARLKK